jgi:ribonuclease HII
MAQAWKDNMKRAIEGLLGKLGTCKKFDVIIDGKFARIGLENSRIKSYTGCVKADSIHYAASCAGILAKVTHDKIIENIVDNKLSKEEKQVFGPIFAKGKGYWYNQIHSNLLQSGIYTQFHRKSFNPLKKFIVKNKQKDYK